MIVLFLLLTVCSAYAQQGKGDGNDTSIITVNGTAIPYSWYENARLARLQQLGAGRDSVTLDQIEEEAILLSLIDAELIREEAERRGIKVGREQGVDLLVAQPPTDIRQIFTDSKGILQTGKLREAINNPDQALKYVSINSSASRQQFLSDWKSTVEALLRFHIQEETRRRLIDALYTEKPLSDADVEHRYFAERTYIEGSVIRVLHSTLPDSLFPIHEAESRAWFNAHQDDYRIPETRIVSSIILPVLPSPADSAQHRARLDSIRTAILGVAVEKRLERIAKISKTLPPNRVPVNRMISPAEFSGEIRNALALAKKGELLGPYPVDSESLLLYVSDEAPSTDTLVRARHILLKFTGEMTAEEKDGLRRFAELLRDSIDSEEEFKEAVYHFSDDKGGPESQGDLGYRERGEFVAEFDSAVFAAPVGLPIGPVQTQYGYHLIWVLDRTARSFALREVRVPLKPSANVQQSIKNDAEQYASLLRSGTPTDSAIRALRLKYPGMVVDSGTPLKHLEPYGDAISTGDFIFKAKEGDVGVLPLPYDRIAVIQLHEIWPEGILPYEDIAVYPIAHARRKKQLDTLEVRLRDMARKMTPEMLLGPIREMAPMAEVFLLKGQPIIPMDDEELSLLDSLATITSNGEVTGPVRGRHALYFLRVESRFRPPMEQYRRERAEYADDYKRKYRKSLLEDLIMKERSYAKVEIKGLKQGRTRGGS